MNPTPRILVCGVNWLGDAIMSMPALQALREHHAQAELIILTKPGLAPLWAMSPIPARVLSLPSIGGSLKPTVRALRDLKFEVSYVLPHSFRSVLPPFLARVPRRIGFPGHFPRDFMLTEVRPPAAGPGRAHQVFEYFDLFFPGETRRTFAPPRLIAPTPAVDKMREILSALPRPWMAVIPGAARGSSKQWPAERYAETAAALVAQTGGSVVTLGTKSEHAACQHLAAALGTPLVALYGITNPAQTGPLGDSIRILQHSDRRTRDVPRSSAEAQKALCAISTAEAIQAVRDLLHKT